MNWVNHLCGGEGAGLLMSFPSWVRLEVSALLSVVELLVVPVLDLGEVGVAAGLFVVPEPLASVSFLACPGTTPPCPGAGLVL